MIRLARASTFSVFKDLRAILVYTAALATAIATATGTQKSIISGMM